MCVIVYKPYNKHVPKKTYRQCFEKNRDGAGFMYPLDGKVVVVKGLFTFAEFWKAYQDHVLAGPAVSQNVTIHFRIGTSGKMDETNCHPHIVAEDFAFVHNGILRDYSFTDSEHSDTIHFMNEIVKPLYTQIGPGFLDIDAITTLMGDHIGGSKMVFMRGEGCPVILNDDQGIWEDEIWFSNTHWKPYVAPPAGTYTYPYGGGYTPIGTHPADAAILTNANGVWIGNSFWPWSVYYGKYPNGNGPYEKWCEKNKVPVKWVDPVVPLLPAPVDESKKKPTQEELPSATTDDTMVTKEDWTALADGRARIRTAPATYQRCLVCTKALNPDEVDNGDEMCLDCLIDTSSAMRGF